MGAGSHRLEYNRNRSFFSVIVANGQWNSFTVGIPNWPGIQDFAIRSALTSIQ